jgi:hypothetical protein
MKKHTRLHIKGCSLFLLMQEIETIKRIWGWRLMIWLLMIE